MRHPNPPPPPELATLQYKEALALNAIADLNKARERAGLPPVHLDVVVQAAAASTDRPPVCAGIDVQAAGCAARLHLEVPSVREVVRLLGVFSRAIHQLREDMSAPPPEETEE